MTLRRYAPLALAALAFGCKPSIEQGTNTATAEYVLFSPSTSQIPLPNDIALAQYDSYLTAGPNQDASCSTAAVGATSTAEAQQRMGLCAYDRAGGFPADATAATITLVRGTLGAEGGATYDPPPATEALDTTTLKVAGAALAPNFAVVDVTNAMSPSILPVAPTFDAATGVLSIPPPAGTWPAGKKYVVLMRGGANGPKTLLGAPYLAMPTLYLLREAVISDSDLTLPDNQGLIPGDAAAKAASAASLEKLRVAFQGVRTLTQGLYAATGCAASAATCIDLPFEELVLVQSFKLAPGAALTLGNGTNQNTAAVTAGAVGQVDAFSIDSTLSSATIAGIAFALTAGDTSVSDIFLSAAADCTGPALGRITSPALGVRTFSLAAGNLSAMPNVRNDATTHLYVCATTTAAGTVSGYVAAVVPFPGTGFTVSGTDDAGSLTVN